MRPLVFTSIFVVNTGYFILSISKSLEMALWANRIAYLGSAMLPWQLKQKRALKILTFKARFYFLQNILICDIPHNFRFYNSSMHKIYDISL